MGSNLTHTCIWWMFPYEVAYQPASGVISAQLLLTPTKLYADIYIYSVCACVYARV